MNLEQSIKTVERDNLIRYLKERQIRFSQHSAYTANKRVHEDPNWDREDSVRYKVIDELIALISGYETNALQIKR
jgi:hypothetical protein